MPALSLRPGLLAVIPVLALVRRAATTSSTPRPLARPQPNETPPRAGHPTLALIDAARSAGSSPLAADPQADRLEASARALIAEYWPDGAWLTGRVTAAQLAAVTDRLDAERAALAEGIRVFVATEPAPHPVER